ncbi:MAG: hypothetical protein FWF49_06105 [Oscillospiraceae bacterium]|nr:hypothetical protein [Oscillospiraceae bacterium]
MTKAAHPLSKKRGMDFGGYDSPITIRQEGFPHGDPKFKAVPPQDDTESGGDGHQKGLWKPLSF